MKKKKTTKSIGKKAFKTIYLITLSFIQKRLKDYELCRDMFLKQQEYRRLNYGVHEEVLNFVNERIKDISEARDLTLQTLEELSESNPKPRTITKNRKKY